VAMGLTGFLLCVPLRYKVDVNAQENFLTGCAVLYRGCCMVLVEGGLKAIERYKKLMLRRIDWNDFTKTEEEAAGEGMEVEKEEKPKAATSERQQNHCDLVWEGTVLKSAFKNFQVDVFPSDKDARKFLKQRGAPHYWDTCRMFRREMAPANHSVQAIIAGGSGLAAS
jgi:U4/U6 small nuclear ribonucleoprotein PRP3